MSDLISRSELLEKLEEHIEYKEFDYYQEEPLINMSFEQLEDIICSQPTVEAVPVVHGEWIKESMGMRKNINTGELVEKFYCDCSICGYHTGNQGTRFNFCPNCGTDMRKKVQDGKID